MDILIIDGQGGNLGRQLAKRLREALPQADMVVVGTNSTATENMLKGGANRAATGENAVLVNARRAKIIAGPLGSHGRGPKRRRPGADPHEPVRHPGGRRGGQVHERARGGRRAPDRAASAKSRLTEVPLFCYTFPVGRKSARGCTPVKTII